MADKREPEQDEINQDTDIRRPQEWPYISYHSKYQKQEAPTTNSELLICFLGLLLLKEAGNQGFTITLLN